MYLFFEEEKMKPKVEVKQVFISAAPIFGIGLLWINFNEKVFKTVRHLISAPFTWQDSALFLKKRRFTTKSSTPWRLSKFHLKKQKRLLYLFEEQKCLTTSP